MIDMMGHRLEEREIELARITSLSKWSIQRGFLFLVVLSTVLDCTGPFQSWFMQSTSLYHVIWNLHDISSVGEEAHCQSQGITSHRITSRPAFNSVRIYPINIKLHKLDW